MARYELKLPHMGESVAEATITSWLKKVGETIEAEDIIVEVATDKVDSEIPCEVSGVVTEILFETDQVVKVGQVMAIIETDPVNNEVQQVEESQVVQNQIVEPQQEILPTEISNEVQQLEKSIQQIVNPPITSTSERFYSPLVRTIAQQEHISVQELDQIQGSGLEGRVTKYDILMYLEKRNSSLNVNSQSAVNLPVTQEKILQEEFVPQLAQSEEIISVVEQESEKEIVTEEVVNIIAEIPQENISNAFVSDVVSQENISVQEPEVTPEISVEQPKEVLSVENQENTIEISSEKPQIISEEIAPIVSVENQEVKKEETFSEIEQPIVSEVEEETIVVENQLLNTQLPPQQSSEQKETDTTDKLPISDDVEIIEMSRMGKLISKYMVESKRISPHVQSFTEVDVTRIWNWRNKVKKKFEQQEGQKFTFTPIFIEAVAHALRDFPMMNVSTDGERIFKKKHINIGMATALPNGDLIVPVIKKADTLSLVGLAKAVNDLAHRARQNKLKPDDITGGTYTVTNIGSFGNVFGTPIINQPEVGILAIGAIQKVPAVIETPEGDMIGIRYKMMLSHSYDHRVVNGALGGMFVQRVAQYLEKWNMDREL